MSLGTLINIDLNNNKIMFPSDSSYFANTVFFRGSEEADPGLCLGVFDFFENEGSFFLGDFFFSGVVSASVRILFPPVRAGMSVTKAGEATISPGVHKARRC